MSKRALWIVVIGSIVTIALSAAPLLTTASDPPPVGLSVQVYLPLVCRSESVPDPTPVPTVPPSVCLCHADLYNCSDFPTHAAAQACYDYCVAQGAGDIHELDSDRDGIACETLP